MPLDAELGRLVGTDLGNQAFHKHLGAAGIELVNHGAQLAVLRFAGGDDQRVGGRVGLDLATRAGLGGCGSRGGCGARGRCGGGWAAATGVGADGSPQGGSQLGGVGVLEVDDVDVARCPVAGVGAGLVQPLDQRAGQRQACLVGSPHDESVGARLHEDGGLVTGIGLAARGAAARGLQQPCGKLGQV